MRGPSGIVITRVAPLLTRRPPPSPVWTVNLTIAQTAVFTSNLFLLRLVTAQIVLLPAGASLPPMRTLQIHCSTRMSTLTQTSLTVRKSPPSRVDTRALCADSWALLIPKLSMNSHLPIRAQTHIWQPCIGRRTLWELLAPIIDWTRVKISTAIKPSQWPS